MTNEATIEKMQRMKLKGMVRAFQSIQSNTVNSQLTADEMIAYLIEAEWDERYNQKLTSLIKRAKFRYSASFESVDYRKDRNLDKNLMQRLQNCDWLRKNDTIVISGSTGSGKSYLASVFGNLACKQGFKTIYFNCIKLFSRLKFAKAEGRYEKEINQIQRKDLLIMDDFGLEILDGPSRLSLLEIIEDRQGRKSTIITSQLPVENWFDVIGDPTIADAVCDRIIHSSIKINLEGEDSMRKFYPKDSG